MLVLSLILTIAGHVDIANAASLPVVADTYTKASEADRNFGTDDTVRVQKWSNITGFARFDLSGVGQSSVDVAILKIPVDTVDRAGDIEVFQVDEGWTETSLTHSNRPDLAAVPVAVFFTTSADNGTTLSVDITPLVNNWLANPGSNHGLALSPMVVNLWAKSRESGQGMLIETSTLVATPTPANRFPQSGAVNESANPTLDLTCTSGIVVAAQYQIAKTTNFASRDYDSGTQDNDVCSHRSNANLAKLQSYYWRGRQRNENGSWSGWSTPTQFTVGDTSARVLSVMQDGVSGYNGTRDADIRGSGSNPQNAIHNWNQGAQDVLRTGRRPAGNPTDEIYRSLLKFDTSALSNAGDVVNAWIELTGWQHDGPDHNQPVSVLNSGYRLYKPWGEGQGITEPPAAGEVSWLVRQSPQAWGAPGASLANGNPSTSDRASSPLFTSRPTNGVGNKTILSSHELVDLVRTWIANPGSNQGLLLKANDESLRYVMNFASREHANPAYRPRLVIETTESGTGPVDPTQYEFPSLGDSTTQKNRPDSNFGDESIVRVQKWADLTGFAKFDLTTFPVGVTAASAYLELNIDAVGLDGDITVHKVLNQWQEQTLTQNNKPAIGAVANTFHIDKSDAGSVLRVDITSLFNQLLADPAQNFGVALAPKTVNAWIKSRETGLGMRIVAESSGPAVNASPVVNAGPDQNISLPAAANLAATVTDDGLPNPPAATTVTWQSVSGPAAVTFDNPNSASTQAHFRAPGSYQLRVVASDGELSASDTIVVSVASAATNIAPIVSAGADFSTSIGTTVQMSGNVSDDGLPNPPAVVATTWSKVSGPGSVTFGDSNNVQSSASFSATGVYVLKLTASDGALQASDSVSVTVSAMPSTFQFAAVADSYTRSNTASTNYGSEALVRVQNWANITGFARFDFSAFPAGVTAGSAYLELDVDSVLRDGDITVHRVLGNWTEYGLSENNKPGLAAASTLFSISSADAGRTIRIDITALFNQLVQNPTQNFGIALAPGGVNAWFGSREAGSAMRVVATPGQAPVLSFTEITATASVAGPAQFGSHGSYFADIDNDGFSDLYVTRNDSGVSTMSELFYHNVNGSLFSEQAASSGIDNTDLGSHGSVFADFDNDGDFDLFNGSYQQNRLYKNNGSGAFIDNTGAAGLPVRSWPTRGVVAFDMDSDGDLDIVAINGYKGTNDPAGERNEIYRNNGNGTFTTINMEPIFSAPAGQGVTAVDYDNDGDVDLFAANRTGDIVILKNISGTGFEIVAPSNIGIHDQAGDGISFADVNNDRNLDMLLDDRLYLSNGNGTFTFKAALLGPEIPYMGGFSDLDLDGDVDLVFPGAGFVYLNDGAGNFSPGPAFPLAQVDDPRSVAFADIDNDGDDDFFYAQADSYNVLVRNNYSGPNRSIRFALTLSNGQAGAFGARIYVYAAGQLNNPGALISWREIRSQDGYLSQSDPNVTIGVGNRASVDVRIDFPGGGSSSMINVTTGQSIQVHQ